MNDEKVVSRKKAERAENNPHSAKHDMDMHPDIIELCTNCQRASCSGDCDDIRQKTIELFGVRASARGKSIADQSLTYKRQTMTAIEWANRLQIKLSKLDKLIKQGYSMTVIVENIDRFRTEQRLTGLYEYNGKVKTVEEWAEEYGMHFNTLRNRLRCGKSMAQALNEPVHRIGGKKRG